MATLTFFIKQKSKTLVQIRCRLRAGREIDQMALTGYKAIPEHWSNKDQKVKNIAAATYKDDVNKKLTRLREHVIDELAKIPDPRLEKGWLAETIEYYHNPRPKDRELTLYEFIQDFIDNASTRPNPKTGRPVCYKMQREYQRTFQYLKDFANYKRKKIDWKDITLDFYHDWVNYLQNVNIANKDEGIKHMATNTIGKKIQTLKIFLNAANDEGHNKFTHYKSHRFKALTEESDSVYLSTDELAAIGTTNLNPELTAIRDLFMIGCWTGLRFSDWNKIKPENIKDDLITIQQQKTRDNVVIPVHPDIIKIIEKYSGKLPRIPTNQHFNRSLKTIVRQAGITEKVQVTITRGGIERTTSHQKWELIGTHTARRSFATNAYHLGVPTPTIMACTGHRSESAFLKYLRVTPEEHARKMLDFWRANVKLKVV